jgi:TetR/AcrR family transcriptional regulator, cholesterol catabolism regulator
MPSDAAVVSSPRDRILTTNQAARRQRIVSAALDLLQGRDYERIQVKDVAEQASVALGTLYNYFPSKEALFGEALVQWAERLGPSITRRPLAADTPFGRVEEALHRSVRAFERQPQLARFVSHLEASDDPLAVAVLIRLNAATEGVYRQALGELNNERATMTVRVLDAVLASALRAWSAGRMPIRAVYRRISEAVALLEVERSAS